MRQRSPCGAHEPCLGHSFPFSSLLSFSSMASRLRLPLASGPEPGPLLRPQDKQASWICFMFSIASFLAFFSKSPCPCRQVDTEKKKVRNRARAATLLPFLSGCWRRKQETQTFELLSPGLYPRLFSTVIGGIGSWVLESQT